MECGSTQVPEDIDLVALRAKYELEREKRRRPEGLSQYVEAADDFAAYYEADPHSPPVVRDPVREDVDAVVLGGGFAGLIVSARLKGAGINSLRVIEKGGDFGGTWYWNRYPGIQCDVESYSYLPLLEELGYIPKDRYSFGPEIFDYCRRIGRHFNLYEHALFGTTVCSLRWDATIKRWRISTNHHDDIRARFLVMTSGPLNKPKLPGIAGIKDFAGHTFHTARWDYAYTGGDSTGGLTKLADKRVAIIGTGATAVQCVPYLGRYAKHLYVIQRTPSSVDERGNRRTDPAWAKTLTPGWQDRRQRNFHVGATELYGPDDRDSICDGWTEINRNLQARLKSLGNPQLPLERLLELRELEDYKSMERIRRRVDATVHDKNTAAALKAWYRFGCKRPCFNDEYLPTFNRPNVTLVDVSAGKGVDRITAQGIVANGIEYEVDCIVYASGFEVTDDLKRRFAIQTIEGRDGLSLYDHWGKGFRTMHGMTTHGFPNFFLTGFAQGALSASLTLGFEVQAKHIAYIVKEAMLRGASVIEPSQEAQDNWVKTIRESSTFDEQFWEQCTPGYFNQEGKRVSRSPVFGDSYGPGFYAFDKLLNEWRGAGKLEGFTIEA